MLKESEVNLSGLSPEALMKGSKPMSPYETQGYQKAMVMLSDYLSHKTASVVILDSLNGKDSKKPGVAEKAKKHGINIVGGAAIGKTLSDLAHNPSKVHTDLIKHRGWKASVGGATLGLLKSIAERPSKKITVDLEKVSGMSPSQLLKAAKQVGSTTGRLGSQKGLSLTAQIRKRLIGRKGVPSEKRASVEKIAMETNEEAMAFLLNCVKTREDKRAALKELFGSQVEDLRKDNIEYLKKMFQQAEASFSTDPLMQKISSITPRVDEFLEKVSQTSFQPTLAQQLYPELLKVASGRPAISPQQTPNLGKRTTSAYSGPSPVRSNLSGGSA